MIPMSEWDKANWVTIPDDALDTEKYISNEDLVNWFFDFSDEAHYQKALKVARKMDREREKKAGKK